MKKAKRQSIIGLDIGLSSVKRVDVVQGDGPARLERVSILPLADNSPETLKAVLGVLFDAPKGMPKKKIKQLYKHTRISVAGPSLLIRRITLPLMSRLELKGAIRFEAENHVPFPIDDCTLDFQILNENAADKTMNVMLVAAKKDFIEDRLRLLAEFQVFPELVDVDIFCLINAFELLGEKSEHKAYGILNIGSDTSSFALIFDKQVHTVRDINLGSTEITKYLMETKGLDSVAANELKASRAPEVLDELRMATHKGFEILVDELRSSIQYFEEEAGEPIGQVWVSGGGARAYATDQVLTELLAKPVQFWDNTKKLEVFAGIDQEYLKAHASEINVALGLALRGLEHT